MKYIINCFLIVLFTESLFAMHLPQVIIQKQQKNHTFEVRVESEAFDSSQHDTSNLRNNMINGRVAYGVDGALPQTQISSLSVQIDGKAVNIPPALYSQFFNPNLHYENPKSLKTIDAYFDHHFNSIFIFMNGGDGAGAYSVVWTIDREGNGSYCVPPMYDMHFSFDW